MTIRLADLEAPLEDVEFPDGTKHVPVPWGPAEYKLWRELPSEADAGKRGRMVFRIVVASYPTATEEELLSLTGRMLWALAAHAGHKIDQVMDALKNGDAAAAIQEKPSPEVLPNTTPFSPKPNGNTSASSSRKRSAKSSGTSTGVAPTASHT